MQSNSVIFLLFYSNKNSEISYSNNNNDSECEGDEGAKFDNEFSEISIG